jgi:cation transport ATPase
MEMIITESRFFYHWRLAGRGGAFLVSSLVAAIATGAFAVAGRPDGHFAGLGIPPAWALAAFVALLAVAALLWWRFSSLQDEMFRRVQNFSYGWDALLSVAVLVVWGIANAATLAPPIEPLAPLLVFAICKSFFWTVATRKWL